MIEEATTIKDQAATLRLKGYSTSEVMRLLCCSKTTVKRANKDIKAGKYQADDDTKYIDRIDGTTRTIIVNGIAEAVRSEDDMLRFFGIDRNVWSIERQQLNSWGSVNNPSAQRKLKLIRNPSSSVYEDYIQAALKHSPKEHARYPFKFKSSGKMMAVSIHDLHHGLFAWAPETGEDYDVKISEKLYLSAVAHYCMWAESLQVEKIQFMIGSDFYNVNSQANTTIKGTPQQEDTRWQKSFVTGREMAVKAIEQLRQVCPVEVVVVSGNHGGEREFMLGDALYCYYRNCDNVVVDNTPGIFKFKKYGKNLLGLAHGDTSPTKLPMILATLAPAWMWAETEHREFLCGHLHHRKDGVCEPVVDVEGVKVRFAPSLAAASAWERLRGYLSSRETIGTVYDKDHGAILEIPFKAQMVDI